MWHSFQIELIFFNEKPRSFVISSNAFECEIWTINPCGRRSIILSTKLKIYDMKIQQLLLILDTVSPFPIWLK